MYHVGKTYHLITQRMGRIPHSPFRLRDAGIFQSRWAHGIDVSQSSLCCAERQPLGGGAAFAGLSGMRSGFVGTGRTGVGAGAASGAGGRTRVPMSSGASPKSRKDGWRGMCFFQQGCKAESGVDENGWGGSDSCLALGKWVDGSECQLFLAHDDSGYGSSPEMAGMFQAQGAPGQASFESILESQEKSAKVHVTADDVGRV